MYSGKKEEIFVSAFIVATIIMLNSLNVCCKQQIISTFSSSFFFHLDSSVFPLLSHLFLIYVYLLSSSFLSFTQSSTLLLVRNFQCLFGSRSHNGRGFRSRACVTHSGFVNLFFFFFYCPHIGRQISSVMVISRRLLSYISC